MMRMWAKAGLALTAILLATTSWAWDPDEVKEYDAKSQEAITEFKEKDPSIDRFFNSAAGYVVIPTVGKAGFGIGGAAAPASPTTTTSTTPTTAAATSGSHRCHNIDPVVHRVPVGWPGIQRVPLF